MSETFTFTTISFWCFFYFFLFHSLWNRFSFDWQLSKKFFLILYYDATIFWKFNLKVNKPECISLNEVWISSQSLSPLFKFKLIEQQSKTIFHFKLKTWKLKLYFFRKFTNHKKIVENCSVERHKLCFPYFKFFVQFCCTTAF